MSMLSCFYCRENVDTDLFPDSLYVEGHDGRCVCEFCMIARGLRLEDGDAPVLPYIAGDGMNPSIPALCAIAILSAGQVHGESLDHDESQFTGWLHAISEMQGEPLRYHSQPIADFSRHLARINREINAYHFNDAFENYWETPAEFREYGGQCRDYAVAKYTALYNLGVADADMELAAVRIRRTHELHAVLIVRHQGHVYVLDNLRHDVQGPERLNDFEAVYLINRIGWRAK